MHKIAKSLDRGDILAQRKYDIQPGNDSVDIYLKSGRQALSMVKELMEDFDRVWSNARPQKMCIRDRDKCGHGIPDSRYPRNNGAGERSKEGI